MTYTEALSNYDNAMELVTSSNDFSRGYTTGSINTLKLLYSMDELSAPVVRAILDADFGFDDLNALRDALLEIVNSKQSDEKENSNESNEDTVDESDNTDE